MAEETLSQAAIDALLAGNATPSKPKAAAPAAPAPEPKAAVPKPDRTVETSAAKHEAAPPPPAAPASSPRAAQPSATPQATASTEALKSIEEAIAALSKRMERVESALGRIDTLEKTVRTSGKSSGPDASLVKRLEALEGSVITICQIQQESRGDISPEKVTQVQQQVSKMNSAIQALASHVQAMSGQIQKTAKETKAIARGLGSTMGYDIQNTFECQHCGSRGYVVALVKCSACGEEDWWGWWPPPENTEEDQETIGAVAGDEYWGWETAEREQSYWGE